MGCSVTGWDGMGAVVTTAVSNHQSALWLQCVVAPVLGHGKGRQKITVILALTSVSGVYRVRHCVSVKSHADNMHHLVL